MAVRLCKGGETCCVRLHSERPPRDERLSQRGVSSLIASLRDKGDSNSIMGLGRFGSGLGGGASGFFIVNILLRGCYGNYPERDLEGQQATGDLEEEAESLKTHMVLHVAVMHVE